MPQLVRPANYPDGTPGQGSYVARSREGALVGVVNVMGRVFLAALDDPFRAADREIARVRDAGARVIFVDVHAETTSEKMALSWYLDGQVTAVIGTHTHVQTADERILPGGTACLTDVGMTGPHDGVIGMDRDAGAGPLHHGVAGEVRTGHRGSPIERSGGHGGSGYRQGERRLNGFS